MTKLNFDSRWKSPEKIKLLDIFFNSISSIKCFNLEKLSFDKTQADKIDLRGVTFVHQNVRNACFQNVDMSFCSFESEEIKNTTFSNVEFEKTNFIDITDKGNRFESCTFRNTNFNKASIGHHGSKYVNCTFIKCNFRNTSFIRAEFNDCNFIDCLLRKIDFNGCSFEDCSFTGKLSDIWFRGQFPPSDFFIDVFGSPRKNTMKNVSFYNAELNWPTFSDECNLSTIILPAKGRYLLVDNFKKKLHNYKTSIAGLVENKNYNLLYEILNTKNQPDWYLFNLDDLESKLGPEVVNLFEKIMKD